MANNATELIDGDWEESACPGKSTSSCSDDPFRGHAEVVLKTRPTRDVFWKIHKIHDNALCLVPEALACFRGPAETKAVWCCVCGNQTHIKNNFGHRYSTHTLRCCGYEVHLKCLHKWFVENPTAAEVIQFNAVASKLRYKYLCPGCSVDASYTEERPRIESTFTHMHEDLS